MFSSQHQDKILSLAGGGKIPNSKASEDESERKDEKHLKS